MDPFFACLWILTGACALTWILSLVTGEHSWVDRIWSIVPVVYVWVFAAAAGLADARLDLMAALVTLWGIRLTFNFARKGGYAPGGEDYRWETLRGRMAKWQFALFNLFFIVIYQNVLLLLIALPAWTAFQHQRSAGHPRRRRDGRLPRLPGRGDGRRPAAVEFPELEEVGDRRRKDSAAAVRPDRPVPVLTSPELLLRAGAVVGGLPVRRDRGRVAAAVDRDRRGAPDRRCSSGRRSSPRASRSRATPNTPTTSGRRRRSFPGSAAARATRSLLRSDARCCFGSSRRAGRGTPHACGRSRGSRRRRSG